VIRVVAAVIERDGRRLLQQRASGQSFPYAWCSPGGKVEAGETDEEALAREMREEHGVEVEVGERVYAYADGKREIIFYRAVIADGEPRMKVGVGMGWFQAREVGELTLTGADLAYQRYRTVR
jgi:8-oxo-dGTP diphosphatase